MLEEEALDFDRSQALTVEVNVHLLSIGTEFVARNAPVSTDVVHRQGFDDQIRRILVDLDLPIAVLAQFSIVEVPLEAHWLFATDQSANQSYGLVLS